jgi:hypothetical protein
MVWHPICQPEFDNIRRLMAGDFTELNAAGPPAGIPAAALVAASSACSRVRSCYYPVFWNKLFPKLFTESDPQPRPRHSA